MHLLRHKLARGWSGFVVFMNDVHTEALISRSISKFRPRLGSTNASVRVQAGSAVSQIGPNCTIQHVGNQPRLKFPTDRDPTRLTIGLARA